MALLNRDMRSHRCCWDIRTSQKPQKGAVTQPRSNMFSLYALDDWKITRTLTANVGIRYDHFGAPYDAGGFWRSFDFDRTYKASTGQVLPTLYPAALGDAAAQPLWSYNEKLIMPRVGLAWRPANGWVLRAGSGWYASTPHFNNFTILNLMPPYSGSSNSIMLRMRRSRCR